MIFNFVVTFANMYIPVLNTGLLFGQAINYFSQHLHGDKPNSRWNRYVNQKTISFLKICHYSELKGEEIFQKYVPSFNFYLKIIVCNQFFSTWMNFRYNLGIIFNECLRL